MAADAKHAVPLRLGIEALVGRTRIFVAVAVLETSHFWMIASRDAGVKLSRNFWYLVVQ